MENSEKQYVMHTRYGVCAVTDMRDICFPGQKVSKPYYALTPVNDIYGTTIFAPVQNDGDEILIRDVLSVSAVNQIIDSMPAAKMLELELTGNKMEDQKLIKNSYLDVRNSGDTQKLVILMKTIYQKKKSKAKEHKRISEFEAYFMEDMEKLVFGEFGFVLGIKPDVVEDYIEKRIGSLG